MTKITSTCKAITKQGTPCKNPPLLGLDYCAHHRQLGQTQAPQARQNPWERFLAWWQTIRHRYWVLAVLSSLTVAIISLVQIYNAFTGRPALELFGRRTPTDSTREVGPASTSFPPTISPSTPSLPPPTPLTQAKQESPLAIAFSMQDPFGPLGASIDSVTPGGSAENAGIRPGDVVLSADGQPLWLGLTLRDVIEQHKKGETATLVVQRDAVTVTMPIEVIQEDGTSRIGVSYHPVELHKRRTFAVSSDGATVHELRIDPTGGDWSADSASLAFDDGNDIFAFDTNTNATKQLTTNPSTDISPVWAPDGRSIAFLSDEDTQADFQLYVFDLATGTSRRITQQKLSRQDRPTWSPDSKRIAISCTDTDTTQYHQLCIIEVATGQIQVWTAAPEHLIYALAEPSIPVPQVVHHDNLVVLDPKWSPEGDHIAFRGLISIPNGGRTLTFVLHLSSGLAEQLTGWLYGIDELTWSPDGKQIALLAHPFQYRDTQIYTIDLDRSDFQVLTRPPELGYHYPILYGLGWLKNPPSGAITGDLVEPSPLPEFLVQTPSRPSITYDPKRNEVTFGFPNTASLERALAGASEPITDIFATRLVTFSSADTGSRGQNPGEPVSTKEGFGFVYAYYDYNQNTFGQDSTGFSLDFWALTQSGRVEQYWLALDTMNTNLQVGEWLEVRNVNDRLHLHVR